mmetsp:Transcript_36236/g.107014  ORF Transcript_36236/g.107014 Transcript_36236/m.107014 type:complete len:212 (-) Transcript_36236:157-792(-)
MSDRSLAVLSAATVLPGSMTNPRTDVDPLCCRPLVSRKSGAAAVQALVVCRPVRLEAVEEQRIALGRFDREPFLGAVRQIRAWFFKRSVWEDRLAPLVGGGEVHEHGCHALPTHAFVLVLLVMEEVKMWLVLLPVLVVQDLEALLVLFGNHRHLRDAVLDARYDVVLAHGKVRPGAGARGAVLRLASHRVGHLRLFHLALRLRGKKRAVTW